MLRRKWKASLALATGAVLAAASSAAPAASPRRTGAVADAQQRDARVRLLSGDEQAHFGAVDWWCGRYRNPQHVAAPTAECAPWDSATPDLVLDNPQSAIGPGTQFRTPLQVSSVMQTRHVGVAVPHVNVYVFPFGKASHPGRPLSIAIESNTTLRFAHSAWQCAADATARTSLSCYRTQSGRRVLPTLTVLPEKRILEVETAGKPALLSGPSNSSSAGTVQYLYQFDR